MRRTIGSYLGAPDKGRLALVMWPYFTTVRVLRTCCQTIDWSLLLRRRRAARQHLRNLLRTRRRACTTARAACTTGLLRAASGFRGGTWRLLAGTFFHDASGSTSTLGGDRPRLTHRTRAAGRTYGTGRPCAARQALGRRVSIAQQAVTYHGARQENQEYKQDRCPAHLGLACPRRAGRRLAIFRRIMHLFIHCRSLQQNPIAKRDRTPGPRSARDRLPSARTVPARDMVPYSQRGRQAPRPSGDRSGTNPKTAFQHGKRACARSAASSRNEKHGRTAGKEQMA